jgi:hypothetical protein
LFKSARIEPEPQPRHVNGFNGESIPEPDKEINLDEDEEDEQPFKVDFLSKLSVLPGVPGIVTFIHKNIKPLIFRLLWLLSKQLSC